MIRNYIASQIQEISALRALRFFGAALALTHFFTAIFWLRSDFTPSAFAYDAFHVDLSSPEWSQFPICWPQLPNCQAWRILPTSGVVPMLLVYGGGALLSALLFVRGTRMTVAYTSLCALFVFKLYLFSLDYRLMGNYHYMPFWIAVAYLLLPAKRTLIPALLVGFYVAAGALKFDKEWLSGAALVRPAMLNGALLRFLLAYVVFLEVVLAWGLLARRPLVFWPIFSQFVIFHLFSFHIVGPFYPMTMACLLSILILDRQLELSPEPATASSERTGRFLITRPVPRVVPLTLAVFMAFQFYPATIPGDSAITGEGRMFALNMLDAKTQCDPTIYARFKNRTEELSYQRRDLGIRIWCDPIVYWNMARTLCERHRKNPDFVDLDLFLTGRKSTEHVQKKVIELRDFCKHQPQYSTWRDNDWITDEVESDLLPRYGLGYRPVPRAMPERPEQGEPKATTFLYRGDPARRGGALNSDSNDFRYTRVEATWRRENGNVGIHNASKASAAVDASGVYIGGDSGWFFAYDHEGRLKWKFHVAGAARGIHGTPALDEDFVYLGAYNGRLYKLRKTTGEVEWANDLGDALGASPVLWHDSVFVAVEFAGRLDGFVARLRRDSGRVLWISRWFGEQTHSSPTINETDGLVYAGANNGQFVAFDLQTGDERWTFFTEKPIKSTAALHQGRVYFTSWDQHLYALDARTGTLIWKTNLGDRSQSSPTWNPTSDAFVVGNASGEVLSLDRLTGRTLWKKKLTEQPFHIMGSGVTLPAANSEHWTWISCRPKMLCAFRPSGEIAAQISLPAVFDGVPSVFREHMYLSEHHPGQLVQLRFK